MEINLSSVVMSATAQVTPKRTTRFRVLPQGHSRAVVVRDVDVVRALEPATPVTGGELRPQGGGLAPAMYQNATFDLFTNQGSASWGPPV